MNKSTLLKLKSVLLLCLLTVGTLQAQFGGLHIETSPDKVCVGENVRATIETDTWDAVTSFQFTLEWDSDKLEYISHSTIDPLFSDMQFGTTQTIDGIFSCIWLHPPVTGVSFTDQTVFEIVFKVIEASSEPALIEFTGSAAVIEFTHIDEEDEILPYNALLVDGNVELNANPTVADVSVEDATANQSNGSITIVPESGTGPYTIAWDNGDDGTTITELAPGDYKCTISDINDCSSVNGPYAVEMMVNTTDLISSLSEFTLTPNPASDFVNINVQYQKLEETTIRVIDITGKTLYQNTQNGDAFTLKIPVNKFSNGTYFVEIATDDGKEVQRLVVAK
ncbi:MAG: T9SS type A sorting domain-containing protein [Saprospiraceae bacterium]